MEKLIHVQIGETTLEGILQIPEGAKSLVLFAHGSGSSRLSPRNTFVAQFLQKGTFATLLIDLLSQEEDSRYETRFDITLLTERLIEIVSWLKSQPETRNLSLGLFGASTGAAAALKVASVMGEEIKAVVSRGGRPDLADDVLPSIVSPTLFIVGEQDPDVNLLNENAFKKLRCVRKFEIVPKATHLFEEPGCLEIVAKLAHDWFKKHI